MDFELIRFQAHELDVWQRHLALLMGGEKAHEVQPRSGVPYKGQRLNQKELRSLLRDVVCRPLMLDITTTEGRPVSCDELTKKGSSRSETAHAKSLPICHGHGNYYLSSCQCLSFHCLTSHFDSLWELSEVTRDLTAIRSCRARKSGKSAQQNWRHSSMPFSD